MIQLEYKKLYTAIFTIARHLGIDDEVAKAIEKVEAEDQSDIVKYQRTFRAAAAKKPAINIYK